MSAYQEPNNLQPINDLATSPICPTIIASASEDHSIRFWDLSTQYVKQPCVLICTGEGHKTGILTLVRASFTAAVTQGRITFRILLVPLTTQTIQLPPPWFEASA